MKHTKLPWKVYYAKIEHNPPILGIGDSEGVGVTDSRGMMWGDADEAKANAEYICRAVNSHEGLVEALKRSHACATVKDDGTCDGCFVSEALKAADGEMK